MRGLHKAVWFMGIAAIAAWAQAPQPIQVTDWHMQDSATVGAATGQTISSNTTPYNVSSWYMATVPGTVLNTFVDQHAYTGVTSDSSMCYGVLMATTGTIPDIAGSQHRYWFHSPFTVTRPDANHRVWLELGGINYYAWIFVNGTQVGTMYGAFKEAKFDITNLVAVGTTTNYIAVRIRGNYNPAPYHTKQSGTCGNNGGIMSQDGPTFIASQGWDWIPTVPDRDMGIWKPVYVRVTGSVAIRHPWIRTTGVSTTNATIQLAVMLANTSGADVTGTIAANIDGSTNFTQQTVTVPGASAGDTLNVTFANLNMTNPQLWWPNGYGGQHLYTCNITFTPNAGTVSDTNTFKFGVRQFTYTYTPGDGYLIINCNGQSILSKGGNWGMDNAFKRWDLHRLLNQVRYDKEMNFNVVRDWIGMTDREPFYAYCDSLGIMVWSDFWEPHSADMGGSTVGDPANFIANMRDKIYRVRNHPSVVIWNERNETTPTAAFLTALNNFHTELDGTRMVSASSGSGGVHSGGPYTYTSPGPATYNAIFGFHTEFGGPTPMSYESMIATMAAGQTYALNNTNTYWSYHDWCQGNGTPNNFTSQGMSVLYGTPTNGQNCGKWSQLMNYDDYRAAFEALNAKFALATKGATGLLLWMSNCVWPSLMWQTYDYYLEGTGATYGCQHGAEPIHIQYYPAASNAVTVFNYTPNAISNYKASAATYNLTGTLAWSNTATVSVGAGVSTNAFANITAGGTTPYFLDLKLKDGSGNLVSHNFYWLPNYSTNISQMVTMGQATLVLAGSVTHTQTGVEHTVTLKVINTSGLCAVANRLLLTRNTDWTGTRVLPVHYNDNYFSLIPGDTQSIVVKFDDTDLAGATPHLCVTGLNVPQTCFTIPAATVAVIDNNTMAMDRLGTKMYASFADSKLRLNNIPANSAWQVRLFNLQGRMILDAKGVAIGNAAVFSTGQLRTGAYVAMISAAERQLRTMVYVTGR